MPSETNSTTPKPLFGLSKRRIRGFVALLAVLSVIYLVLFESDPPPNFSEVAISIPQPPEVIFDESKVHVSEPEILVAKEETAIEAEAEQVKVVKNPQLQLVEPEVATEVEKLEEISIESEDVAVITIEPEAKSQSEPVGDADSEIRVIALSDKNNANDIASKLEALLEVNANVTEITFNNSKLYRVWLGPFTKQQAETVLADFQQVDPDNKLNSHKAQIVHK